MTERIMSAQQAMLVDELKLLRKGRGALRPDLATKLGPELRRACGITDEDSPAYVRHKVVTTLTGLAAALPDDLRLVMVGELGLHPEATHPTLNGRRAWVCAQLARDQRTVRRRAEQAYLYLAELAGGSRVESPGTAGDGWYVGTFCAVVRLDTPAPEVWERRTIVATRDGVDEIVRLVSVVPDGSPPRHDLNAVVLLGGRLVRRERLSRSQFRFAIRLPRPLLAGQTHEYQMVVKLPEPQSMRPHYVLTPSRRCDRFEVAVRFHPRQLPHDIWRVNGVPIRMVDDAVPGEPLAIDACGETQTWFDQPTPGLCHGIQWRP